MGQPQKNLFSRLRPDNLDHNNNNNNNNNNDDDNNRGPLNNTSVNRFGDKFAWKCVIPSDLDATKEHQSRTLKFWNLCVCKFTNKKGFYNLSHSTSFHRIQLDESTRDGLGGEVNLSSTTISSSSLTSNSQVNFASNPYSTFMSSKLTNNTSPPIVNDNDGDALECEGVWIASVEEDSNETDSNLSISFIPFRSFLPSSTFLQLVSYSTVHCKILQTGGGYVINTYICTTLLY